jgi:prophage DNA circulation protein
MRTASFKGSTFLTESHDTKGGRRLAVHEFPGGEDPVVEDLGGKAGEFHLNAYFIGPDYDLFRDKFLLAVNAPGAEWLTHPWLGQLWVRAHNWSVHESNDKGGYCVVGVDFVPGGGDIGLFNIDRTDLAAAKIEVYGVMPDLTLQPMSDSDMTSFIKSVNGQLTGMRNALAMAGLPLTMMSQARNVIDGIRGDLATLLALPAQYAAAFRSLANLLGAGDPAISDTAIPQVVDSIVAMSGQPVTQGGAVVSPALQTNLARLADLHGQLLLASAAQMALADYRSCSDRDAALASVLTAMDKMLPTMSDTVFQAALDCRAALIDALLAQQLDPAQVRDIVTPLPSTLLAHRMEVSEDVFLAVNKVRHPLFVRGRVYG